MATMTLKLELSDFDRLTADQQFVNVAATLDEVETQQGGLTAEQVWAAACEVIDHLKAVPRPEITVQRMFSHIVEQLGGDGRTREEREHTAHCVLFCVAYILCANDEQPDPNQEIIDNICRRLSRMPDIARLFLMVEQAEDEQTLKSHPVEPRNVLARQRGETAEEARQRIATLIEREVIQPVEAKDWVLPPYKRGFRTIWQDLLDDADLLDAMRQPQLGKPYNLKLVTNVLALMTQRTVLNTSNRQLDRLLFPGTTHYKYFTTDTSGTYSALGSDKRLSALKAIIARRKE